MAYHVHTTRKFDRKFRTLPVKLQKRVSERIKRIAQSPYASNPNVTKLQGREGYRLRIGDWRVLYALQDDQLIMLVIEIDVRGRIYQ